MEKPHGCGVFWYLFGVVSLKLKKEVRNWVKLGVSEPAKWRKRPVLD
jgi:hypothetical protein